MPRNDFIPARDADFGDWLANLSTQATALAQTTTVIAGSDQAVIAALLTDYNTAAAAATSASAMAQQASAGKKASRQTVEGQVRPLVRKWKANSGYTVAIGEQLGVEGPEDTTDLTNAKPTLKGKAVPGGVQIDFNKSKSDGVKLWSKRDGDADWVFLALDTQSPYVDNRPVLVAGKPETRRYRALYVSADTDIGQFSDELVVTANP